MKLLLAEDDRILGEGLVAGLKSRGFTVNWVQDGSSADTALKAEDYALVILDLGLPKVSGMDLLRSIRSAGQPLPVLILTARDSIADRVGGLDAGGDDYMIKPVDIDELAARIRALTRRVAGRAEPVLVFGDIRLNPASHEVTISGKSVDLSRKEFSLLQILLENAGHALPKERLEEHLYGWNEEVESNAIEVHVHHLRKKFGADLIKTIRGVGYLIPRKQS